MGPRKTLDFKIPSPAVTSFLRDTPVSKGCPRVFAFLTHFLIVFSFSIIFVPFLPSLKDEDSAVLISEEESGFVHLPRPLF
jgi:hypothetical protein